MSTRRRPGWQTQFRPARPAGFSRPVAGARYAFYRPKGSIQAQMLDAKANLLWPQERPLTDAERAAVVDGLEALEALCAQLADVPPSDPTPRQLLDRDIIPLHPASAAHAPRGPSTTRP